jgi:hypothetical protein
MGWERRLPPVAEDALELLSAAAEDSTEPDSGEGSEAGRSSGDFTKDEATAVLVADEGFTEADAEHALEVLFQRGYIYYVGHDVYITPTDD